MNDRFTDRFDGRTYADNEPVRLFRPDRHRSDDEAVWVPETLWHRIRHIGAAYDLHLLPLLDGTVDPVFLNPQQVEQLFRELRFVSATIDDPLLDDQISALVVLSQLPSQGASKDSFVLEFP